MTTSPTSTSRFSIRRLPKALLIPVITLTVVMATVFAAAATVYFKTGGLTVDGRAVPASIASPMEDYGRKQLNAQVTTGAWDSPMVAPQLAGLDTCISTNPNITTLSAHNGSTYYSVTVIFNGHKWEQQDVLKTSQPQLWELCKTGEIVPVHNITTMDTIVGVILGSTATTAAPAA